MSRTVFRATLPLTLTSFLNKCGSIGLSLLPILLVEKHVSNESASLLLFFVKCAAVGGVFLGGFSTDVLGLKRTVVVSFLGIGVGLASVALVGAYFSFLGSWALILLGFSGFLGSMAQGMFPSAGRLMIVHLAEKGFEKEAVGWLRVANNLGQVVAYSLGWVLAKWGVVMLILVDSLTGFCAALFGSRFLPNRQSSNEASVGERQIGQPFVWKPIILMTVLNGVYSLLYEFFITGASGRFEVLYSGRGLELFSGMMMINVVLCAVFAIPAARRIRKPNHAFPLGLILSAIGMGMVFAYPASEWARGLGMLFATVGEIVYMALGSVVLMLMLPEGKKQGTLYGLLMVVQVGLRSIGAAIAFPLAVRGESGTGTVIFLSGACLILWLGLRRNLASPRFSN